MKEYIERAEALDICQKEYEDRLRMADYCGDTVAWDIGGTIKGIPAADVAEVRHGRWDASDRYKFLDGSTCIRCTECGAALHLDEYQKYHWHYCPNCGALMREDDNGKE